MGESMKKYNVCVSLTENKNFITTIEADSMGIQDHNLVFYKKSESVAMFSYWAYVVEVV